MLSALLKNIKSESFNTKKKIRLTKEGILRINFRAFADKRKKLRCNFRCSYCIQRNLKVTEHAFTDKEFQQAKKIWDMLSKIEDKVMVRVNFDGETFYDEWAKKCALYINRISNVQICEFITNNSVNPETYLDELDLTKTTFNCTYHLESMSIEQFIENALKLKYSGCDIFANICAVPQVIKKIPEIKSIFRKYDIALKTQVFTTPGYYYKGKKYPEDYTEEQRKFLKGAFDTEDEYEYSVNLKPTKGSDCWAGVDMINIFLDGSVKRCFTADIGNVKDLVTDRCKLEKKPYPCHQEQCPCYTHFIGLKEFRAKYPLSDRFVDNFCITFK